MRCFRVILFCIFLGVALFVLNTPRAVSATNEQQADQNCIFQSDDLAVPDDGSWLQVCLVDPSAPEGSTVTETNVKVLVDHPDPSQLEIRFSRTDSKLFLSLSPDMLAKDGMSELAAIHDFDGLPSQGEWVLQIRDTVSGTMGSMMSATIAITYAPVGKMAQPLSENDGKPTSERIADGALRISASPENEEKEAGELSGMQLDTTGYSIPIMTQTFEGYFPPTGWNIYDGNPNDGKEYYWDDDNLKHYTGSKATWPARGGADGIDPGLATTYPANMDTWMIYGPFDLSNAKSADVAFMLWRHIEIKYDHLFFGISSNGTNFNGWLWDGSADWENKIYSLNSYLGDSDVWIGWHFISDGTRQYEGPWIDDILLKFEPGDITVNGNFTYADRSSVIHGANAIKVQLWDSDSSGNDLLAEAYADVNGNYTFPVIMNWDLDETDPILGNRRLDLYVRWMLENNNFKVTTTGGSTYAWFSSTNNNVNMGTKQINGYLPAGWTKFEAMWFFQDIQRAREFYLNHSNPQVDPGFITAQWDENQNTADALPEGSHFWAPITPHVYIAHDSRFSADTIVHEIGHHVMWNKTGQWLWYDYGCFQHYFFTQETSQCGWSEGWADFFAIAVNGDACYDLDIGPCTGASDDRHFNLENHTRNDPNVDGSYWGDGVEGRVAGALYDLMDSGNETPWYDTASWGFDTIIDVALVGSGKSNLQEFWNSYQGTDKHNGVRSVYQNTIDYDQTPTFAAIPNQNILQNFTHNHVLDLWDFSNDLESPDASLTFQVVSVSDSRCGVSLDSHWINANPQTNWTGSCYVTVRVSDTIPNKTATSGFWVNILQINSRIYLTAIMNN